MDALVATTPPALLARGLRPLRVLVAAIGALLLHAGALQGYRALSYEHAGAGVSDETPVVHLTLIDAPAPAKPAKVEPQNLATAAMGSAQGLRPLALEAPAPPSSLSGPGEEEFVDARLLRLRPAVLEIVALPQPQPDDRRGPSKALFTLFIDRAGQVVRVSVDSSSLPSEIEDESRQAFFRARFRPGMIDGRPVNARMQVEVVFDAPPVDARTRSDAAAMSLTAPAM